MKFLIVFFLIGIMPSISFSQNPLKRELKGNSQSMHYSNSAYKFNNASKGTVFIMDINDNRSLNWNKQVNDSVKIEPIGDYWNFFYAVLFKNKINQDLLKSGVKVEATQATNEMYKIEPTVDVHYPNFVIHPSKGYWILTRIQMKVSKGDKALFTKAYQEYTFFGKGATDYKDAYSTDLKEGANVAMWNSMKRVLDLFYADLDAAMDGKFVESANSPLNAIAQSSIASDPNLNSKVNDYSNAKDKNVVVNNSDINNYKMEDKSELPPPTDQKLDNAIKVIDKASQKTTTAAKSKPVKTVETPIAKVKTPPAKTTVVTSVTNTDSIKAAEKKLREEARKLAIDSALKVKAEIAAQAKIKEEEDKAKAKAQAILDKARKDSILKVNQLAMAEKMRARLVEDSIKRVEKSKMIEIAKKKREEERAKMAKSDSGKQKLIAKVEVPKIEKPKVEKTKVEKKKPTEVAQVKLESKPETDKPRVVKPKTGNEDISAEIRRIAREVEMEERGSTPRSRQEISARTPKTEKVVESNTPSKVETEVAINTKAFQNRKLRMDSLLAARKAKAEAIAASIQKAKDSMKAIAAAKAAKANEPKPIDPKKFVEDSIKLAQEKIKKREAIIAAQKAVEEAEKAALAKSTVKGEMFAIASTDPPSKLPDNRTREQVLADRVFTPKSTISNDLLSRVKMITPEDEYKLKTMSKNTAINVDSFFIHTQINRPIPTHTPIDTNAKVGKKSSETKDEVKSKVKSKAVDKGLKDAKAIKDSTIKARIAEMKAAKSGGKNTEEKKVEAVSSSTTEKAKPTTEAAVESEMDKVKAKLEAARAKAKAKTETPKTEETKASEVKSEDQKAQELESDIEKKKKELKDKLEKAKANSW